VSRLFEELDYRPTAIGLVSLRRRRRLSLGVDIFEIKLGDAFLMTSLFTASEEALARAALAALPGERLAIAVGGLGLGYTAKAVLAHDSVDSLLVVEMLSPVIEWHCDGLLPLGPELTADPRCRFLEGDFFALAESETGLAPDTPGRQFDALLVDIDHSPEALLDARSESFYRPEGLARAARYLRPGGIFGLWSNEGLDPAFTERLAGVFDQAWAEPVTFDNPLQGREMTQTVYLARKAGEGGG